MLFGVVISTAVHLIYVLHLTNGAGTDICDADVRDSNSGVITSPGWPNSFPSGIHCASSISVAAGQQVSYHFTELDIAWSPDCSSDYVEVSDVGAKDSIPRRFCDSGELPTFTSSSNKIEITFHSNRSDSGSGFQLVYVAVRKDSTSKTRPSDPGCPLADVAARVPKQQETVEVELLNGVRGSLQPGVYPIKAPVIDGCTADVTVTKDLDCPKSVSTEADAVSKTGFFEVRTAGAAYNLTFSQGNYNYTKGVPGNNCSIAFKVLDHLLEKRLAFVADYDITCAEYQSWNASILQIADYRYNEIRGFCDQGCTKPVNSVPAITAQCSADVLTVSWPTAKVFPGSAEDVPEDFAQILQPRLQRPTALDIIVFTTVPRVEYPLPDGENRTIRWSLLSDCGANVSYDEDTNTCL